MVLSPIPGHVLFFEAPEAPNGTPSTEGAAQPGSRQQPDRTSEV